MRRRKEGPRELVCMLCTVGRCPRHSCTLKRTQRSVRQAGSLPVPCASQQCCTASVDMYTLIVALQLFVYVAKNAMCICAQ